MPSPMHDPNPSDIIYDDMTRAWRNGDYPLSWNLADALLQYLASGGQPLTGGDFASQGKKYNWVIHVFYTPGGPLAYLAEVRHAFGGTS